MEAEKGTLEAIAAHHRRWHPLTAHERIWYRRVFVEHYRVGMSMRSISAPTGVSTGLVRALLWEAATLGEVTIRRRGGRPAASRGLVGGERIRLAEEVADAYEAGETVVALAARYGRSEGMISSLLADAGVRPVIGRRLRVFGQLAATDVISRVTTDVIAGARRGMTIREIAAREGVSAGTVHGMVVRHGVRCER